MRVLYNTCSDGFSIPETTAQTMFKQYPPTESEIGRILFRKQDESFYFDASKPADQSHHWNYRIKGRRPFCSGWQQLQTETVYSLPILTEDPDETDRLQDVVWSNFVENDAGEIYDLNIQDTDAVRTTEPLIRMLETEGWIGRGLAIETVPEGASFEIEEGAEGDEQVHVVYPIQRILTDLLRVAGSQSIDPSTMESLNVFTRQLLEGSLQIKDMGLPSSFPSLSPSLSPPLSPPQNS